MEPELFIIVAVIVAGCLAAFLFLVGARVITWAQEWQLGVSEKRAEVARKWADNEMYLPNERGALPVPVELLKNPAIAQHLLALASQIVEAQSIPANVPHTLTYSPHFSNKSEGGQVVEAEQIGAAMFREVPGFSALFENGIINKNNFLLGYTPEGEPINGQIADVYSSLIIAKSGGGKTTLQRFLLAQAVMKGAKIWVADPHGHTSEGMVKALQPLARHFACKPAIEDEEISEVVRGFVAMGEARLKQDDPDDTIQILAVDELNDIASYSEGGDQIVKALIRAARSYRKVHMYVFASCQSANAEDLGGTTGIRKSFVGRFVLRSDKDAVNRLITDKKLLDMVPTLEPGRSIFVPTRGAAMPLAIPNTTVQDLRFCFSESGDDVIEVARFKAKPEVLPDEDENEEDGEYAYTSGAQVVEPLPLGFQATSRRAEAQTIDDNSASSGKSIMIGEMYMGGMSKSQIIAEVWGVSGGRSFQSASIEYDDLLRDYFRARR